jgi:hypothetical protein
MRFQLLQTLTFVALLATAQVGRAQDFVQGLSDPRIISLSGLGGAYSGFVGAGIGLLSRKPQFGIEAGEFILQPRFFLESEYRSNFFRQDSRNADAVGALTLHVRPGVALFNPQYDLVAFSFGTDLDVFLPFGEGAVSNQTNIGARAQISAAFFPKSNFTLTLYDRFERQIWMRPIVDRNANRNHNVAGVDLSLKPGGRALDFNLGYAFDINRFDEIGFLDTDTHRFRFLTSWRFFPQTFAFIESTLALTDYRKELTDSETQRAGNYVDGAPFKVFGGLSGHLTERLAIVLRLGYGNSFLSRGADNYESFVGQAQVSWRFSPHSVLHVGAMRDFDLAAFGGYVGIMRAYTEFSQRIGELVDLNIDFSYDVRDFGVWEAPAFETGNTVIQPGTLDTNRHEKWLRAGLGFDFDISRLFGITAGYRFEALISDFVILTNTRVNYVGFSDHRVFASLNLRY